MEKKKKYWIIECIYALFSIVISLVGVVVVYKLWNKDFSIPIVYNGDGEGALITIKNIIDGNSFWFNPNFSAPYGESNPLQDYILPAILIKIISFFSSDIGIVTNVFWLSTYVFTAVSMYMLLRKVGIRKMLAVAGSVVYNFLPYHYFRLPHFWIFGCYIIPLAIWLILDISEADFDKVDKDYIKKCLKSKRLWINVIFCILIGTNGIYYSVFTVILLTVVAVCKLIERKRIIYVTGMAFYSACIFIPISIFYILPGMGSASSVMTTIESGRSIVQLDVYALRLMLLLLPIPGHRISVLSNFTNYYYETFGIMGESYISVLGLIMSIGFLISIFSVFCRTIWGKWNIQMELMGKLNIFIVIFATFGGFDFFVGYFISSSIRCYNRLSVFLAAFSIIAFCMVVDEFFYKFKKQIVELTGCIVITIFGIWDQTSSQFAEYTEYNIIEREYVHSYEESKEVYINIKKYMKEIEEKIGEEAAVYFMPLEYVPVEDRENLSKYKVYIAGESLKTNCYIWDSGYSRLLMRLESQNEEQFINALSILGFKGIVIDKNSFASDEIFKAKLNKIEEITEQKSVAEKSLELYFLDISEYANNYVNSFSEEKLEIYSKGIKCLMDDEFQIVQLDELKTSDNQLEWVDENESLIVKKGDTQYGPYCEMKAGKYNVIVRGNGLRNAVPWVTVRIGEEQIDTYDIVATDTCISYKFELKSDETEVEFLLRNSKEVMQIKQYVYVKDMDKPTAEVVFLEECASFAKSELRLDYIVTPVLAQELHYGGALNKNENVYITMDQIQYGPYTYLKKGKYRITAVGKGLQNATLWATADCGEKTLEIVNEQKNEEFVSYILNLDEDLNGIEFLIRNDSSEVMRVDGYYVESIERGQFPNLEECVAEWLSE